MNRDSKLLFTAIAVLLFTTSYAQNETTPAADTLNSALPDYFGGFDNYYSHPLRKMKAFDGRLLTVDAGFTYSSNCVVNSVAIDFYNKQYISGASINNAVNNLSAINSANRDALISVKYLMPIKPASSHFIYFNFGYRNFVNLEFSDEAAKFVAQGNSQFAGKKINGGGLDAERIKYDFFQAGWMKYFMIKGHYANFSAGLSLVRGSTYFDLTVPKAEIFTEQNGEYITANINATLYKSSYYDYNFINFNGYGSMLDMRFNLALSHNSGITAELTDLGFVSWKHEAGYYTKDTTVQFNGVYMPSFDSLANESYVNRLGDSLVSRFNVPLQKSSYIRALPFRFNLYAYLGLTEKSYLNIRLRAIGFSSYRPQLCLEYQHFFNKKIYGLGGVALGGFGAVDFYGSVGWQIKKRIFAGINLYGFEGMIMPQKLSGLGGGFSVAMRL